eukprot:CAMPEP_0181401672 /NCGR_PEP_ID=MMETSP1110-20121109/2771_1 /TAXON_ID=174948 /ORGANISM="Symbiodinium sp., Strain CCMP421" /LENGTH=382 /DNA_ID=CAMNT_0023523849 /DNA_START=44 /DNA_END=1192 /DNA_ORIENTATION=+
MTVTRQAGIGAFGVILGSGLTSILLQQNPSQSFVVPQAADVKLGQPCATAVPTSPSPGLTCSNFSQGHHAKVQESFEKRKADLLRLHEYMADWQSIDKSDIACHAPMCILETEMLYLTVRENRPTKVFELGPACAWSSMAILLGLLDNDHGHLFSFDMEHKAPFILNRSQRLQKLTARWTFVLGNIQSTYQPHRWDFMYIDALHENHFTEWWLHNVLKPLVDSLPVDRPAIPVQVHDVFVPYFVPGDGAQTIGSPTPDKPGIRYNDCVAHGFTPEELEPEIECVRGKTRDVIARDLGRMALKGTSNWMFGPHVAVGEGPALMQFLTMTRLPQPSCGFTPSPFANMPLFKMIYYLRQDLGLLQSQMTNLQKGHNYNPSFFFVI